ncbi:MAG: hypothetical protein ACI3ZZ_03005 [Candidatus Aphodosoma sp.]
MKRSVLFLWGILIFFSSCERDNVSEIQSNIQFVKSPNCIDYHVVDNTIHFATQEDVYKLELELSLLNQSQLDEWEEQNQFCSFRKKYDEVTDSLIKIDDEHHFFDYLESNKEVLFF